jgi:Tfp pilus assembly protein PilX
MVLMVVMLLVIMFTGLGLLAMRHTRLELRASGAYQDATQAAALAEGGLAIVATDLRLASDYYQFMFTSSDGTTATSDAGFGDEAHSYTIPLSPEILSGSDAGVVDDGTIPQLTGNLAANAEQGAMYGTTAQTTVTQSGPVLGPCPVGYSCADDQNYAWYYFTINSQATYGAPQSGAHPLYESGRAQGRGRVTVGPIAAYGR